MALTDNCDIFASINESAVRRVLHHVTHQRPALVNYGSPGVVQRPELLCRPLDAHPVAVARGNTLITALPALPVVLTDTPPLQMEWCFQLSKLGLDVHPGNEIALPPELAPRMNKSGSVTPFADAPNLRITAVHAEHSSLYVWKNPATDKDEVHVGGEPGGFIIEFENGFKIWHMGDTGVFGDMKFIGELTEGTATKKVTVLHEGSVLAEGTLAEVQANEKVVEVYLGR